MYVYSRLIIILLTGFTVRQGHDPEIRVFRVEGRDVRVTCSVDPRFYGKYSGSKGGYLVLNPDGSGEYLYDYFGYALPSCEPGPIRFKWGFLVDEKNQVVKFVREYGFSIPVIYQCTGPNSFQGCRKNVFVDYLLDRKDGTIEVSSSDDWKKIH